MMTLLEIIQQVTAELGLNQPAAVVSSQDPQTKQFLALLNRLGVDLVRQFEWQRLNKEYILTTVSYDYSATFVQGSTTVTVADTSALSDQFGLYGPSVVPFANIVSVDSPTQITMNMPATESQTVDTQFAQYLYDLPSDWKKQVPQTEWDRTNRWPLMGPQSAQDWQSFKSGIVYAGPRERFRILENQIAVNPLPPNGLTFAFEYISNAWVRSSTGTAKTSFTADTDTCIFDDSLMVTGLKAQWKAAKGLDGTFDLGEFRLLLDQCKAQDKSSPRLSLSPYPTDVLLTEWNLPDGNWPSS